MSEALESFSSKCLQMETNLSHQFVDERNETFLPVHVKEEGPELFQNEGFKFRVDSEIIHQDNEINHTWENKNVQEGSDVEDMQSKYIEQEIVNNIEILPPYLQVLLADSVSSLTTDKNQSDLGKNSPSGVVNLEVSRDQLNNTADTLWQNPLNGLFDFKGNDWGKVEKYSSFAFDQKPFFSCEEEDDLFLPRGERQYKCEHCSKSFSKRWLLTRHCLIHSGEKTHQCDVCHKSFSYSSHLKRHQWVHVDKKPYTCTVCNKSFSLNSLLLRHTWTHAAEKPYKCSLCNKSFSQRSHLKRHQLIHSGTKTCKSKSSSLQAHLRRLNSAQLPQPFKCDKCFKSFSRASHLKDHQVIHSGHRDYKCDICNKSFYGQSHLNRHNLIHVGEKSYKCGVCNKLFLRSSSLIQHMVIHTGVKSHSCEVCGKSFSQKGHLKRHQLIHTRKEVVKSKLDSVEQLIKIEPSAETNEKKSYSCDICQKTFLNNSHLKRHKFIHTGDRPFKCDQCSKSFLENSKLQKHYLNHLQDRGSHTPKTYSCEECGKVFRNNWLLKRHQLVHSGNKPFNCEACGKSFTRISYLKKHQWFHTQENPDCDGLDSKSFYQDIKLEPGLPETRTKRRDHTCEVCSKSFLNNSHLKRHQLIHTRVKPFHCKVCSKGFTDSTKLIMHELLHTQEFMSDMLENKISEITYFNPSLSPPVVLKKVHECNICHKYYSNTSHLNRHKLIHTGVRPYKCDKCIKAFTTSEILKKHQLVHTREEANENCPNKRDQSQTFDLKPFLKYSSNGEKSFQCDLCSKSFPNSSNLKRHRMIHTGEKPYVCEKCNKAFSQSSQLKKHQLTHLRPKSNGGRTCSKFSPLNQYLTYTSDGDKAYKCDICSKVFLKSWLLRRHQLIHTGERRYKCDLCGKAFSRNAHLKNHQSRHTRVDEPAFLSAVLENYSNNNKEASYACNLCNKVFMSIFHLQRHQPTHYGEKRFQCDTCQKRFRQSSHLKRHELIHARKQIYQCDVCSKVFSLHSLFNRHILTHKHGDKCFKCEFCSKAFVTNSHLKQHTMIHTGERPHKCEMCSKSFIQRAHLNKHQKVHSHQR